MEMTPEILEKIEKLHEKYSAIGQDMLSYLEGLIYARSLTYWDYIHLDTLLSLQNPKTDFPDEMIFIGYHQITELYFKLIQHEIDQICLKETDVQEFGIRINRINGYFRHLITSFEVMVHGMDRMQFLQFRMSLLPASGFQSAQYRMIEIKSMPLWHLVDKDHRSKMELETVEKQYDELYWKYGNLELATGKKTLTLSMFEEKYDQTLKNIALEYQDKNIYLKYLTFEKNGLVNENLKNAMRTLDLQANVYWPLSHYKSAVKYLNREPDVIKATGGTNWQNYLPPKFQRVIGFPALWTGEEREEWGKNWVLSLFKEQVEDFWTLK